MHWLCCRIDAFSPEALQQAFCQLSPSRKAHIQQLKQSEDQTRSLCAELLLRQLLQQLGLHDAILHRKPNGQPYLTNCDLYVSISHRHEMVACAVSQTPVGIDVEHVRPINLQLCRHVCTPEEKAYLLSGAQIPDYALCRDPDILQRFFEIWTAKEAYFKKCGTGITDLKSVNILPLQRQIHTVDDYIIQIV